MDDSRKTTISWRTTKYELLNNKRKRISKVYNWATIFGEEDALEKLRRGSRLARIIVR